MTDDDEIDTLFREIYQKVALNHKEFCTERWGHAHFARYDQYAEQLVEHGLVTYTDAEKVRIVLTDYGESFGKESTYLDLVHKKNNAALTERIQKEVRLELDRVNLKLAKRQLKTFWTTLIIALISLLLSIIALLNSSLSQR